MPQDQQKLTRADLPEELTAQTVRQLPMSTLRRLARPGNGVLGPDEQAVFDAVLHEVMRDTAGRVSRQINRPDWATVLREANGRGGRRGAVLVAGWAPIVAADDWDERVWILGLTIGTCVVAGVVYGLIRRRQNRIQAEANEQDEQEQQDLTLTVPAT